MRLPPEIEPTRIDTILDLAEPRERKPARNSRSDCAIHLTSALRNERRVLRRKRRRRCRKREAIVQQALRKVT